MSRRTKDEKQHPLQALSIEYRASFPVSDQELNTLFADAWPDHEWCEFAPLLTRSLGYVCAYHSGELVGFVNVAWDGGAHAFLLDTTVRSDMRRRGIGLQPVRHATDLARKAGATWLHVDFVPSLRAFYRECGFRPTEAGLIDLRETCDDSPENTR